MIEPVYQSDRCTLYCGDCLQVLPQIGHVDLILMDPPYGIGWDTEKPAMCAGIRVDGTQKYCPTWNNPRPVGYGAADWDSKISDGAIRTILKLSDKVIMWGGNYYTDILPASGGWLVWDKGVVMPTLSKCELAWTNIMGHVELCRLLWAGYRKCEEGKREHPTQKPIAVMAWCIQQAKVAQGQTILDPFMGSGTTGVAAMQMGCKFIGIEINPKYCEIAMRRIKSAESQLPLFKEEPQKDESERLF